MLDHHFSPPDVEILKSKLETNGRRLSKKFMAKADLREVIECNFEQAFSQ